MELFINYILHVWLYAIDMILYVVWYEPTCMFSIYVSLMLKFENKAFRYLWGFSIYHKTSSCEIPRDPATRYIVCSSGCLRGLEVCWGFWGLEELTTRCVVVYLNNPWLLRHSCWTMYESILNDDLSMEIAFCHWFLLLGIRGVAW